MREIQRCKNHCRIFNDKRDPPRPKAVWIDPKFKTFQQSEMRIRKFITNLRWTYLGNYVEVDDYLRFFVF
jgi:hypothetical protein